MTRSIPRPPKHLKAPTRRWFETVVDAYELEPHHVRLLTLAGESWDRAVAAREAIQTNGLTYTDRFGSPRVRPEVSIERDSRLSFARLVRELRLDVSPPEDPRIPGMEGGRRAAT